MKKKIVLLGFFLISLIGVSQETTIDTVVEKRNEIQLNGLFLILGAIEIDYEYLMLVLMFSSL